MKLLAFVDVHRRKIFMEKIVKKVKKYKVEVVVCAGDLSTFERGLSPMITMLGQLHIPVIMTHGNHETPEKVLRLCNKYPLLYFVHNSFTTCNNYLFLGYGGGGFGRTSPRLEKNIQRFQKIATKKPVIFITHAPGYHTKLDKLGRNQYCGNKTIRKTIELLEPVLHICGHIHENAGKYDYIKKTLTMNPGPEGKVLEIHDHRATIIA
ncbi:metallophosphoesterase [Candidatus Woesearchaeota archaeon]|nr:metallophosphoesterase [Candidatus Woesearchaeota archaeon]